MRPLTSGTSDAGRYATERLEPAAEPLFEVDLGRPAEDLAGARDVGPAYLRVVGRERLEDDLTCRARDADHRLRELEHRHFVVRVAEVHRQVLSARREQVEAADQVVDVAERTCLRAVAVDPARLVGWLLLEEV